jgi:hypothetical protein
MQPVKADHSLSEDYVLACARRRDPDPNVRYKQLRADIAGAIKRIPYFIRPCVACSENDEVALIHIERIGAQLRALLEDQSVADLSAQDGPPPGGYIPDHPFNFLETGAHDEVVEVARRGGRVPARYDRSYSPRCVRYRRARPDPFDLGG